MSWSNRLNSAGESWLPQTTTTGAVTASSCRALTARAISGYAGRTVSNRSPA